MARAARQKGGVAYLQRVQKSSSMRLRRAVRFDSRRLTKKLPANSHPPPSVGCAALRRHLPLRGGGLLLPWRGELGPRSGASQKRLGSRRRPKTRQPEAPQTRNSNSSPFGGRWRAQRDRRGASRICNAFRKAAQCASDARCVSIRGVSPRSSQLTRTRPPPSAALRYAATSGWRITIALAGRVGSAEWRQPEAPWFAQAPQNSPARSASDTQQ